MARKRAVVIHQVTRPWLPLAYILRCLGWDIFYIEPSRHLKNIDRIRRLEGRGIHWIKRRYRVFSETSRGLRLAVDFSDELLRMTRESGTNSRIAQRLGLDAALRRKLDTVWGFRLYRAASPFAEQCAAARHLVEKEGFGRVWIISFGPFARLLRPDLGPEVSILSLPEFYLAQAAGRCLSWLRRRLARPGRHGTAAASGGGSTAWDADEIEVVYFPHVGIYYGSLFKKDQFYSENPRSPFHPTRTLHLSLGEKNDPVMKPSREFYEANGIPYADITDLPWDRQALKRDLLSFLAVTGPTLLRDALRYGFWYAVNALFLYASVRKHCLIFSRFKRLRVALAGYDYVFPRDLCLALSLLGVKTCASQERFIHSFWPDSFYLFDLYFTTGEVVARRGLRNNSIGTVIPAGPVRMDLLHEFAQHPVPNPKYDRLKAEKTLVMALDFTVPRDDIDEAERLAAKLAHTRSFYADLIRLAREFPTLHIVIKGKDLYPYSSPCIADLVREIGEVGNIEIELELEKISPYYIAEKADFTIACHTSLGDELLAAGRKVIFYDPTDHVETLFDYGGLPIFVKDYAGLKSWVARILAGEYVDEDRLTEIRRDFYGDSYHGHVGRDIRAYLERYMAELKKGPRALAAA